MYATPRTRPRLFMAGKLNRRRRAFDGLSRDALGELRARMTNAAIACAVDGLLSLALLYAGIARKIDRMTGSPYALPEEEWRRLLLTYARRS